MSSETPPTGFAERWPIRVLREVVDQLFVGLPVARYQVKNGAAVEEPVLSVGDISEGELAPRSELTRVALRPGSVDRFRVQAGDLVVSCRGTALKAARVPESATGLIASSNLIVIRPGERLLPALLLALLRSNQWQEWMRLRSRSSTALIQLTVKDLEDLPVPMPSMALQVQLAAIIDAEEEYRRCALRAAALRRELVEGLISGVLLGSPNREPSPEGQHE